jgi:hypothetical protein
MTKNTSVVLVLVLVLSLLAVLASPVFSARMLKSTLEEGRRRLHSDATPDCYTLYSGDRYCVGAYDGVDVPEFQERKLLQEDDVELELEEEEAEMIGRKLQQEDGWSGYGWLHG